MSYLDFMFDTLIKLFTVLGSLWNGEIAALCLIVTAIFVLLYRSDQNPHVDFEMINFVKTNGQEDPYKIVYLLLSMVIGWGFILLIKNKALDVWMLIVFCGYAFGPPMFNSTLRVITNIFGKDGSAAGPAQASEHTSIDIQTFGPAVAPKVPRVPPKKKTSK